MFLFFDEFSIEMPTDVASLSMVGLALQIEAYVRENKFTIQSKSQWPYEGEIFPGIGPTTEEFPSDWPTMRIVDGRCNSRDITLKGRNAHQAHCVQIAINDESRV